MKYKHIIVIYLIGSIVAAVGMLFKVMHWPYAGIMIALSFLVQVAAIIVGIVKVLNDDDAKSFLNR
jgi:hypothetical protein